MTDITTNIAITLGGRWLIEGGKKLPAATVLYRVRESPVLWGFGSSVAANSELEK